ncbi:MAG: carbonic anhydrase [Thermodesulfobacteriota bacterium]|nr:carbonic anhydrase [Thermodesulfobacteriota bacterium]
MIHKNVITDFVDKVFTPQIDETAFIHPLAAIIGHVFISKKVMVSPFASVRGDEGNPLFVGDESNVQDGVIIHALETELHGKPVIENRVEFDGKQYAVYIGKRVSLAHQVQIHGPAIVGDDTFVGMKTLVFKTRIGDHCVVEPGCVLMGIEIAPGRYVPAGSVVKTQKDADNLPEITDDYPMKALNQGVVHVNTSLADGYLKTDWQIS